MKTQISVTWPTIIIFMLLICDLGGWICFAAFSPERINFAIHCSFVCGFVALTAMWFYQRYLEAVEASEVRAFEAKEKTEFNRHQRDVVLTDKVRENDESQHRHNIESDKLKNAHEMAIKQLEYAHVIAKIQAERGMHTPHQSK